jgi:fatty acid desaturase
MIGVDGHSPAEPGPRPVPDFDSFDREIAELGGILRSGICQADLQHLIKIERAGRLCFVIGLVTAWVAPNPLSAMLMAQGMMARFIIGHHVGHGGYDAVPGIPVRYTRKRFAQGWRRFIDWLEWWGHEDWLYTHNRLHHPNTQAPLDSDVMDSMALCGRPMWVRVLLLGLSTVTWKFSYYAPRMRRERASRDNGVQRHTRVKMRLADLFDLADPAVQKLWIVGYAPYVALRFVLPTLLASLLGPWAAGSMFINLLLAELLHNAQTFVCIRPSHSAADIPLFVAGARSRKELYAQSVLGTVNYRSGGDVNDFLHGWTNYQVEHHLWPNLTLMQYQKSRPYLLQICRRNNIPYKEGNVIERYIKTARLYMAMEHQTTIDTRIIISKFAKKTH